MEKLEGVQDELGKQNKTKWKSLFLGLNSPVGLSETGRNTRKELQQKKITLIISFLCVRVCRSRLALVFFAPSLSFMVHTHVQATL